MSSSLDFSFRQPLDPIVDSCDQRAFPLGTSNGCRNELSASLDVASRRRLMETGFKKIPSGVKLMEKVLLPTVLDKITAESLMVDHLECTGLSSRHGSEDIHWHGGSVDTSSLS